MQASHPNLLLFAAVPSLQDFATFMAPHWPIQVASTLEDRFEAVTSKLSGKWSILSQSMCALKEFPDHAFLVHEGSGKNRPTVIETKSTIEEFDSPVRVTKQERHSKADKEKEQTFPFFCFIQNLSKLFCKLFLFRE